MLFRTGKTLNRLQIIMNRTEKKFSWRAFISFGLLFSFIIMSLTGIVLYLAPAGRVSNWVNWKLIGFTKAQWQALHTVFSYTFIILAVFHLFSINWRVFISYIKNKTRQGLNRKRELWLSTVFTLLFFLGIVYSVPPFSSVMDFGEYLTESWEKKTNEPPIPHAELLTLTELSHQLDSVSIEKIVNRLKASDIRFNNTGETLEQIGALNNMPPIDIYNLITKRAPGEMTGAGMGRKTLSQIAGENNKDIDEVLTILKEKGIIATPEMTLKDIAAENDMAARDIYELIK